MKHAVILLTLIVCLLVAARGSATAVEPEGQYTLKGRLVTFTPVVPFELDDEGLPPMDARLPYFPDIAKQGEVTDGGYSEVPTIDALDATLSDVEFMERVRAFDIGFNFSLAASAEATAHLGEPLSLSLSATNQPLVVGGTRDYSFTVDLGVPERHSSGLVIVKQETRMSFGGMWRRGHEVPVAVKLGGTYHTQTSGWQCEITRAGGSSQVSMLAPGYTVFLSLLARLHADEEGGEQP